MTNPSKGRIRHSWVYLAGSPEGATLDLRPKALMSGTDRTKASLDLTGPVVILVEPQLGENIGMAARAMGNFALDRLSIVNPRDGWPSVAAQRAAAGADHIINGGELFGTVEAAVADCSLLFATTARAHDQAKPVV